MRYQESQNNLLGASNSLAENRLAQKASLRIVVEESGSLPGIETGHIFELGNDTTIIGRDSRSDICLNDPGVCNRHLILNHTFGIPILENLSESITPIIEGSPLKPGDKRTLDRGSSTRLQLGDVLLNLQYKVLKPELGISAESGFTPISQPNIQPERPFLGIEWEHDRCHVRCKGRLVDLFPISARVLGLLCETPGAPVHKSEIRKLIGPAPQLEQQVTYIRRAFGNLVKAGMVTEDELRQFIGLSSAGPHLAALQTMPVATLLRYFIAAKRGFGYVIHIAPAHIATTGQPQYLMLQPAAPGFGMPVQPRAY